FPPSHSAGNPERTVSGTWIERSSVGKNLLPAIFKNLCLTRLEKLLHKSRRWKRMAPMTGSTIQYRMAQVKRAEDSGWIEVKGVSKSLSRPRCWSILYKKEGIR